MGQLSEPIYIGAIAVGAAIFSAIYWLFGFLRMGTTGLVAQAFGAKEPGEVARTYVRAFFIATSLGFVLIAIQHPMSFALFSLFNASDEVQSMTRQYFSIRIYGAPAVLITLASLGVLFGLQKMKSTLILTAVLNLTNLILDIVFVLIFEMGVEGIALGTLISEWVSALLGCFIVVNAISARNVTWDIRASLRKGSEFTKLFNVSGNLFIRTFFVQIPFFVGTILATDFGEVTLAAHGILMQLYFVMTYGLDGFAHTAESLSGYSYGANDRRQFEQSCYYCFVWAGVLSAFIALTYLIFAEPFISYLTTSEDVRISANQFIPWIALAPILCVGAFILDGIFIGITHIRQMRNSMFFASIVWAATLISTYSLIHYHAIWLSMSAFMLSRTIFLGYYFRVVLQRLSS